MAVATIKPGTLDNDIISSLDRLVREAQRDRDAREVTMLDSQNRYVGKHWKTQPPRGLQQFTINRTQKIVRTSTAIQTQKRPRVSITPVETNDPPVVYLTDSGSLKTVEQGTPGLTDEQKGGLEPITPEQAGALAQGGFGTEDFVIIDDEIVAESFQAIFNRLWVRADADFLWFYNVLPEGHLRPAGDEAGLGRG